MSDPLYAEDGNAEINEEQTVAESTVKPDPGDEKASRPWFMTGGERLPEPALRLPDGGRRIAKLWPQEDPGSDRITNQLMYVPPEKPDANKEKKVMSS